jgi:CHAT domain-containing protein
MYPLLVRTCWWISMIGLINVLPSFAQLQPILKLRSEAEKLYDKEDFRDADSVYRKAFSMCLKGGYPEFGANLLVDISSMEHLNGNYREGTVQCLQAMRLLKTISQPADSSLFKVNASLGELYRQLQYVDSSAFYFSAADQLLVRNPAIADQIPEYVIYHFSNQSMLHELVGRFSLSEKLALRALDLTQDYHLPDDEAIIRNVLAGQLERTGQFARAMELRLSGLTAYKREDLQKARMYSGIGRNALSQKKYTESLKYLLLAYNLYMDLHKKDKSQDDSKKVIALCNHLGRCYLAVKQYARAEHYFDEAVRIHEKEYGRRGQLLADSWMMKGKIKELNGKTSNALSYCQDALSAITLPTVTLNNRANPLPDDILDERLAMEILSFKGLLLSRQGKLAESLATYKLAVEVFHHARRQLYLLEDKLYLSETVLPVHRQAQEVAYQYYRIHRTQAAFEAAFALHEQVRAAALQDFMAEMLLRPKYLPEKQIREEIGLRQELVRVRSKLLSEVPKKEQRSLARQEYKLRHEHYRLLLSWETEHSTYFRSRFQIDSLSIAKVQAQLPGHAAYLTYGYDNGKLHLFAISRDQSVWKTVPVDSSQLFNTLSMLRGAISMHPVLTRYQGTPHALRAYEWFISPLLPQIGQKEEWIINPGGVLDGLPVEVLETGKTVDDYLAKHFTIRYVYSASLLGAGTISTPDAVPATLTISPFAGDIPAHIQEPFLYKKLLPPPPPANPATAGQLINEKATLASFLREQEKYPIWYFSTHAMLDLVEPMRSYVAFFPNENSYSHRLYADEISQMDLRHVKLVSLNACDTGGGKIDQAEGIMSLARAFAYAGCPVTVNTLWTAHDRSSVYFFKRFRHHLENGGSPSSSLRNARNDFFESKENNAYNHPYFWANYVVIGSDIPIYPPQPTAFWQIAVVLAGLLVVFLSGYTYQKSFRR